MAENKTKATSASVDDFIAGVDHAGKRADALVLDALFQKVTGVEAAMWGPTIIGYGSYTYTYDSGRSGTICRIGFSPRKAKHSLYLLSCSADGDDAAFAALRDRLGKYAMGKGCMYVNKLADIDLTMLEEMIGLSWANSHARWPEEG